MIARYATGVYGLSGRATPEQLVPVLDDGAYITGAYALYRHNLIAKESPDNRFVYVDMLENMLRD